MGWAVRNSLTELGKGVKRGNVSTKAPVPVRLLACAGSRWRWRRRRYSGAGRSRQRLEDLVDVGALEGLEKATTLRRRKKPAATGRPCTCRSQSSWRAGEVQRCSGAGRSRQQLEDPVPVDVGASWGTWESRRCSGTSDLPPSFPRHYDVCLLT